MKFNQNSNSDLGFSPERILYSANDKDHAQSIADSDHDFHFNSEKMSANKEHITPFNLKLYFDKEMQYAIFDLSSSDDMRIFRMRLLIPEDTRNTLLDFSVGKDSPLIVPSPNGGTETYPTKLELFINETTREDLIDLFMLEGTHPVSLELLIQNGVASFSFTFMQEVSFDAQTHIY